MRKIPLFILICSLAGFLPAKNLRFVQTINPFNYELIDVEIDGNLMIVPAGLGGAEIYDISDPLNPATRGNMELRGCAWDRSYNWDIGGAYAVGTARDCGFGVFDISNPDFPKLATVHDANDDVLPNTIAVRKVSLEDVEIVDDVAIFAAHGAGLIFYDLANAAFPKYLNNVSTDNAWSLAVDDGIVYVADGEFGIAVVSIKNINTPHLLGRAQTSGTARDIRFKDGLVFVAVGNAGVDVFDVGNPSNPVFLADYKTSGFTSRVAVHLPYVSASSWNQLNVLKWENSQLSLYGYKNTGGRVMAVGSPGGDIVYSAEWEEMHIFKVGEIAEADIDVSTRILDYGQVAIGETKTLPIKMENNGDSELQVLDTAFTYDEFSVDSPSFTLAPHSKKTIDVLYAPQRTFVSGSMIFFTNDPDEEQIFVRTLGNNADEVQEGEDAPGFDVKVIANGSGRINLEDLRGRVVVLAMFASW